MIIVLLSRWPARHAISCPSPEIAGLNRISHGELTGDVLTSETMDVWASSVQPTMNPTLPWSCAALAAWSWSGEKQICIPLASDSIEHTLLRRHWSEKRRINRSPPPWKGSLSSCPFEWEHGVPSRTERSAAKLKILPSVQGSRYATSTAHSSKCCKPDGSPAHQWGIRHHDFSSDHSAHGNPSLVHGPVEPKGFMCESP